MTNLLANLRFTDLLGDGPEGSEEDLKVDTTEKTPEEIAAEEAAAAEAAAAEAAKKAKPKPEDNKDPEDTNSDDAGSDDIDPDAGSETIISTVAQALGYEMEEGEEYEETYEGLANFTKKAAEKMANSQVAEFFAAYPDVEEFVRYRMAGGDPTKYLEVVSQPDYSKITLAEDDEAMQRTIVTKFLSRQGFDETEIKETLEDYANTGILFKQAQKAQGKLNKITEEDRARVIAEAAKRAEKEQEENNKLWSDVQETVAKGVIKGIQIPESEKKSFFAWLATPVKGDKQGRSQRAIERESMDVETMVALEYLYFKKLDLSKLIKAKANTLQAEQLKDKLKGGAAKPKLGGTESKPTGRKTELPSLNELF